MTGGHAQFFAEARRLGFEAFGHTDPNPAVGAVLVSTAGEIVGRGRTQPPGGPHAEVMAIRDAGQQARGARCYVTLEPCNHTGRTGPCAQALITAGVAEAHYLYADPSAAAGGGAETLRAAGVTVHGPYAGAGAIAPREPWAPLDAVEAWLVASTQRRPHVTLKLATTLDGRIAAADGTSQWITSAEARAEVHQDRARRSAILVGTGTVLADNPRLTARDGSGAPLPADCQPLRVIMGERDLPPGAAITQAPGSYLHVRSHDPHEVLRRVWETTDGRATTLLVEGGARIAGAFLAANLVDEIRYYAAPALLGGGLPAVTSALGELAGTIGDIRRFTPRELTTLGPDLRLIATR